jgi:hypothetical protein
VQVPYAAIPILFGVQQLVEGGLWLGLPAQTPATHLLAIAYLLFSNVLWPVYVPFAVWLIEPDASRRRAMLFPMAAGVVVSAFFMASIVAHPVWAVIKGAHIGYHLPHPAHDIALVLYAVATCIAPLLSSFKMVRLFAIVIIVSMLAAYVFYALWFASTWCFFAALASVVVYLQFSREPALGGSEPHARWT